MGAVLIIYTNVKKEKNKKGFFYEQNEQDC
jgi:hypothetical protein